MSSKRRRSKEEDPEILAASKKTRTRHPLDYLSDLSDELLIRILHNLPIQDLLQCQRLSRKFYTLAGDSQIWKNLYYNRFVLPRALRIPGIKTASPEEALHFSSRRSKWLDEGTLVNRVDGKKTYWKGQYKLRHNWSIGACDVQEIHVADRPSMPDMLIKLAEGVVLTADREDGLRAWDLKGKELVAKCDFKVVDVPTCLAIDEQESQQGSLGIAVGFMDGGWGVWKLDVANRIFAQNYRHPPSSNGTLSAVAFAYPYALTITDAQLLSLYTFGKRPPPAPAKDHSVKSEIGPEVDLEGLEPEPEREREPELEQEARIPSQPQETINEPYLLASLKSHTSWPPLSLSIRTTPNALIASVAYCLPTYLSGYTIGLQELHLSIATSSITFSRLTSAQPQGFHSILSLPPTPPSPSTKPSPSSSRPAISTRPTSLSYSHPYILATHPDNTLTLYLCTSTSNHLHISPGTKLWGHTSSVSSAEITPRGKAVSVSTRGNELRVWELEAATSSRKRSLRTGNGLLDRSVMIRPGGNEFIDPLNDDEKEIETRKNWVGFDDEMVIVLKESRSGTQALMVYDFT